MSTGWVSVLSRIAGRDDAYNLIEGLRHGGLAEQIRRNITSFGSGWNPLRAIAKEALGIRGQMTESAFRRFMKSSSFQAAIGQGRPIREIGRGGFGAATLMETRLSIGGREVPFQYVAKEAIAGGGDVGRSTFAREVRALRRLEGGNAPSFYGLARGTRGAPPKFYMEYFPGRGAGELISGGGRMTSRQIRDLEMGLGAAHQRGIAHLDLWRRAARTPGGSPTTIGRMRGAPLRKGEELVPHNIILTPEGRVGIIDWGLASRAANDPSVVTPEVMAAVRGAPGRISAARIDTLLVQALKKQSGGISSVATSAAVEISRSASSQALTGLGGPKTAVDPNISLQFSRTQHMMSGSISRMLRESQRSIWEGARSGGRRHRSYSSLRSAHNSVDVSIATGIINEKEMLSTVLY